MFMAPVQSMKLTVMTFKTAQDNVFLTGIRTADGEGTVTIAKIATPINQDEALWDAGPDHESMSLDEATGAPCPMALDAQGGDIDVTRSKSPTDNVTIVTIDGRAAIAIAGNTNSGQEDEAIRNEAPSPNSKSMEVENALDLQFPSVRNTPANPYRNNGISYSRGSPSPPPPPSPPQSSPPPSPPSLQAPPHSLQNTAVTKGCDSSIQALVDSTLSKATLQPLEGGVADVNRGPASSNAVAPFKVKSANNEVRCLPLHTRTKIDWPFYTAGFL